MKLSFRHSMAMSALVCAALAAGLVAEAKTFKWANSGDVSSMDPYARQETFLLTFTQNIYDPLVRRDKNLKLEPALATKWGQTDKTHLVLRHPPQREVQRRHAAHRRRHRVLAQPRQRPGLEHGQQLRLGEGDQEGGRPPGRGDDQVSRSAARRQVGVARHDVQGVGREEQRAQLGRHDQERGELRDPQRHGHRPVHAEGAQGGRAHRPGAQPELVGQADAQPHRGDLHAGRQSRRPASPRSRRATST